MNQVLHQVARRSTDRQTLTFSMFRELDQILKNCVPRKSVFFAFDGPGPLAKLLTQRRRRNKAKKEHTTTIAKSSSKRARYAKRAIDRLEFTPGVDLLYFVRDAVTYWAYSRLQNDRKYRNVDIRISGSDVPGEGELKLIDFCRAANLPELDSVVIVGGDADIVLQGLATTPVRNFFVYLHHYASSGRKKLNYVVSVWELSRTLERLFPNESSGVRIDFILFSILNGNGKFVSSLFTRAAQILHSDFLRTSLPRLNGFRENCIEDYIPKVRGVTLGRLWRRYLKLKNASPNGLDAPFKGQCLVDAEKRTINWPLFHALIDNVGNQVRTIEEEVILQNSLPMETSPSQVVQEEHIPTGQAHTQFDDSEDEVFEERILYTGNEDGIRQDVENLDDSNQGTVSAFRPANTSDGSAVESDEESYSEDIDVDDDYEVDEDANHIDNLISISGTSKNLYDTERWFRCLLWTLHMYVDGYCSDFNFQYGKPYGPSCEVLSKFITDHNGDPFVLQAPISNAQPLLPHQAAFAMLPKHAIHLLPTPLQHLVNDPVVSKRIFLDNDVVNIPAMLQAICQVPEFEYSAEELRRTIRGQPFLLRRPRPGDRVGKGNPAVARPGPKFDPVRAQPVVFCKEFKVTTAPPCYPWPKGSLRNMLDLPYKKVGGNPLRSPTLATGPNQGGTIPSAQQGAQSKGSNAEPNKSRGVTEARAAKRGRRRGHSSRQRSSRPRVQSGG